MTSTTNNTLTLQITHDKLLDILIQSATRKDVINLENKINNTIARLEEQISRLQQKHEV